jgi:hypothetical protein
MGVGKGAPYAVVPLARNGARRAHADRSPLSRTVRACRLRGAYLTKHATAGIMIRNALAYRPPPRLHHTLHLVARRASAFGGSRHRAGDEHGHLWWQPPAGRYASPLRTRALRQAGVLLSFVSILGVCGVRSTYGLGSDIRQEQVCAHTSDPRGRPSASRAQR